jgi:hypothetical protein
MTFVGKTRRDISRSQGNVNKDRAPDEADARRLNYLRFHGVSTEELDAAGVTATEFAYLIASFEAASVYYRFHERSPKPFKKSSLRYKLLATPATRKAWAAHEPLFRRGYGVSEKDRGDVATH